MSAIWILSRDTRLETSCAVVTLHKCVLLGICLHVCILHWLSVSVCFGDVSSRRECSLCHRMCAVESQYGCDMDDVVCDGEDVGL